MPPMCRRLLSALSVLSLVACCGVLIAWPMNRGHFEVVQQVTAGHEYIAALRAAGVYLAVGTKYLKPPPPGGWDPRLAKYELAPGWWA